MTGIVITESHPAHGGRALSAFAVSQEFQRVNRGKHVHVGLPLLHGLAVGDETNREERA